MMIGLAILTVQAASRNPAVVLVEAEAFAERGGWVVDSQFMDQMGSPFLLAHGLGRPVFDATTQVLIQNAGDYRVFVRTRDWVAPWGAPGAPGRFQVVVNGKPLGTTFGTERAEWHWQDGGTVALPQGPTRIALHDLTGFEGRCDAIVLSADPDFIPPDDPAELAAFRERHGGVSPTVKEGGRFDLVVVGGGIAGMCASLVAARLGLRVALVQDRPVLGGNNSSEVRVWLGGETGFEPYPRIGEVVRELEPSRRAHPGPAEYYEDDRRLALFRSECNIYLFINYRANHVRADAGRIRFITAQHTITGQRLRLSGKWFVDCTGDGAIGFLAGADYEITPRGHMGPSDMWSIADTGAPSPFPRCPWAFDLTDKPIPPKLGE